MSRAMSVSMALLALTMLIVAAANSKSRAPPTQPVFALDCDKTIVFYDSDVDGSEEFLVLPASSTGLVGRVSRANLKRLQDISRLTAVVCASGMRVSTMLSRYKHFPGISYWICENGGRVFDCTSGEAVELVDWLHESRDPSSLSSLKSFVNDLKAEGWHIDDAGYESMVRVKGSNLKVLVSRIPSSLRHVFNLNHLDIMLPAIGKRTAIEWLLRRLGRSQRMKIAYLFMGDDDNDVSACEGAVEAFICTPRSPGMDVWVKAQVWRRLQGRIHEAPEGLSGHSASGYLLDRAILNIRQRDMKYRQ